jgi:hypothetical protein
MQQNAFYFLFFLANNCGVENRVLNITIFLGRAVNFAGNIFKRMLWQMYKGCCINICAVSTKLDMPGCL